MALGTNSPTLNLGDPGIFIHYGTFELGTLEWPESKGEPTRIEIGTKFVVRRKEGGMACLHLLDGRIVWVSSFWLDNYTQGGRFVEPL